MPRNPLVAHSRASVAVLAALLPLAFAAGLAARAQSAPAAAPDPQAERAGIKQWRRQRIESLTSDSGWLTLAALFWLKDGANSFGRDPGNSLVLDNPALAVTAGIFAVSEHKVRFIADPHGGVRYAGQPVETLALQSDAGARPTVLESGTLRFFVIERA